MCAAQSAKPVNENLTLKSYEKKVKEDIRLIHENLHDMLKLLKIDEEKGSRVTDFLQIFAILRFYRID